MSVLSCRVLVTSPMHPAPALSHTPRWVSILFPDGEPLTRVEFDSRLSSAEFSMPMGPRGNVKAEDDALGPEALDALWAYLSEGAESLGVRDALRRLQDMSPDENRGGAIGEGPDSLDWKAFAKGLGAAPFEKWI